MRYAQTIYKVSMVQGLCKVVFQEFYLTENSYSISKELTARVAQSGQLEFLHKSGIALRPGGTPEISRRWNRRDRDPKTREPRRGGRPRLVCHPSGARNISLIASGGYAPLHHRLISAAPPAQKICVETLAGPLCATLADHFSFNSGLDRRLCKSPVR